MRKSFLLSLVAVALTLSSIAQEFKVITIVESIIPMGLGRSRIIEHQETVDPAQFTTNREDGVSSEQANVSRSDIKIEKFSETKLLNFYSAVGINFQNIASNDAVISAKINAMIIDGWELAFVVNGVESVGDKSDNNGIYVTRLFFKR
jgi:ParB-like chromosome segregation protein Spo0J